MSTATRTIPCPPKLQRRRMIAGMGTSPAVLTETVWALALKVKGSRKDEIDFQS